MTFPKHVKCVPEDRKAVAPYNFVELPEKIVEAEPLPSGDRYHDISEHKVDGEEIKLKRHTGTIKCILTTESPLYTRGGWTPDDFAKYSEPPKHKTEEERKRWKKEEKAEWEKKRKEILAPFFSYLNKNLPVIPGSSIRGMLRSLVEIVSFSKIDRVSDAQRFFFRAVAAEKEDPLAETYKKTLKGVKAGYLVKKCEVWHIRPAQKVDDLSFVWIKDKLVEEAIVDFVSLKSDKYYPQYKINISFGDTVLKNGRRFARKISVKPDQYQYVGVLATSGNMAETGEASQTNRKNHCLIREPDLEAPLLRISDDAISDYCSALTAFQKQPPYFTEQEGILVNGRCIFYCEPEASGGDINLFGQSPNFRIPYSPNGKAATARDFIPPQLKDVPGCSKFIDLAEAMFGFVRRDKQTNQAQQARSGRIFISDAILCPKQEATIQSSLDQEAQEILLSSPKPTTFQHYLVQPKARQKTLKHYASQPPTFQQEGETVIRGHKLYWHKRYEGLSVPENTDTQTSLIMPIDPDIEFAFDIYFENLSKIELGALLWILSLSSENSEELETGKTGQKYWFSLGMGKPFGMGAVTIAYELYLSNRPQRYQKLFRNTAWEEAECAATIQEQQESVNAFESFILHPKDGISDNDHPEAKTAKQMREIPRIEMFLAMLQCDSPSESVEYMSLEDFKGRKVLPNPLDVRGVSDQRRFPGNSDPNSGGSGESDSSSASPSTEKVKKQEKSSVSKGQEVEAKVVDIQVQAGTKQKTTITYEIDGSDCPAKEEVYKKKVPLTIGSVVKVTVDKVQGRNIRKVKHL